MCQRDKVPAKKINKSIKMTKNTPVVFPCSFLLCKSFQPVLRNAYCLMFMSRVVSHIIYNSRVSSSVVSDLFRRRARRGSTSSCHVRSVCPRRTSCKKLHGAWRVRLHIPPWTWSKRCWWGNKRRHMHAQRRQHVIHREALCSFVSPFHAKCSLSGGNDPWRYYASIKAEHII